MTEPTRCEHKNIGEGQAFCGGCLRWVSELYIELSRERDRERERFSTQLQANAILSDENALLLQQLAYQAHLIRTLVEKLDRGGYRFDEVIGGRD